MECGAPRFRFPRGTEIGSESTSELHCSTSELGKNLPQLEQVFAHARKASGIDVQLLSPEVQGLAHRLSKVN